MEIKHITEEEARKITKTGKPKGLFYKSGSTVYGETIYIGIDNLKGPGIRAFKFKTETDCIKWLRTLDRKGGDYLSLELQPITFKEAKIFINEHHRHNTAPQGHKFSIGLNDGKKIVGVIVVGRPIARHNDDGLTLEVTRNCVLEGNKNACSKLYAAAWRVTRNLGYKRLITYTLLSEPGTSLKAAGWKVIGKTEYKQKGWDCPSRPRIIAEKYPTGQKTIWEIS